MSTYSLVSPVALNMFLSVSPPSSGDCWYCADRRGCELRRHARGHKPGNLPSNQKECEEENEIKERWFRLSVREEISGLSEIY